MGRRLMRLLFSRLPSILSSSSFLFSNAPAIIHTATMSSPSAPAGPPAEPPADSSSLPHRNEVPSRPEDAAMPPSNRSLGRDVHIYDSRDASAAIGGLILTSGVTNSNLYTMVEIFVLFES